MNETDAILKEKSFSEIFKEFVYNKTKEVFWAVIVISAIMFVLALFVRL